MPIRLGFLPSASHKRLMAGHAEDALGCAGVSKILDLPLAVSAPKAAGAECLVARKDCQILNLVPACATAVCAIVANERSIAEEQKIRVGVEQGPASIAAEAIDVPSVSGYFSSAVLAMSVAEIVDQGVYLDAAVAGGPLPSSNALPSSRTCSQGKQSASGCCASQSSVSGNVPLRNLCTGIPHHPPPLGTPGSPQATPSCFTGSQCTARDVTEVEGGSGRSQAVIRGA